MASGFAATQKAPRPGPIPAAFWSAIRSVSTVDLIVNRQSRSPRFRRYGSTLPLTYLLAVRSGNIPGGEAYREGNS
jgi:hypothetical protein